MGRVLGHAFLYPIGGTKQPEIANEGNRRGGMRARTQPYMPHE
jgi:hypothetical protein